MSVTTQQVAKQIVHDTHVSIAKASQTGYTQGAARWSGVNGHHIAPSVPPWADCSAWEAWLFWQARVKLRGKAGIDMLNGLNWQAGNTDSMIRHGRRHRGGLSNWFPGRTLLFYGGPLNGSDPTHTTIYLGASNVGSHGQQRGPLLERWNYRLDFRMAIAYQP